MKATNSSTETATGVQQRKETSYITFATEQNTWTLRKRIRNKTSLAQCIILAARSMYFRVKFHRKLRLSLQGCWKGPSHSHGCIPACITRSPGWLWNWVFWWVFLTIMSLTFSWVDELIGLCSPMSASPRAREAAGTGSSRHGRTAPSVGSGGLAAPDLPGHCPSRPATSGHSRRVFPRWGTDLLAPSLPMELVELYLSPKYYPCVTTSSYSLYVWQLLSQIRSRHAGKHYHPICFIFLTENRCWLIRKNSCFLELQILLSLSADTPSHWSKMRHSFTFFSHQLVLPEEQNKE